MRIYRQRDRHDEANTFFAKTQMNLKWPHESPVITSFLSSGRNPETALTKEVRRKDLQTDNEVLL